MTKIISQQVGLYAIVKEKINFFNQNYERIFVS